MSIVGISSISSTLGNQAKTAYCASKAAMDAVVRCFAKELAPSGIRANTVCPGMINTDIYEKFKDNATVCAGYTERSGEEIQSILLH